MRSPAGHMALTPASPSGSMYDGLADNYNYGTANRSYYSKLQAGSGSWGYPVSSRPLRGAPVSAGEGVGSRMLRGGTPQP